MRPLVCLTIAFALLSVMSAARAMCPGCEAPSTTLSEQVELSAHMLLGKWVGGEKPTSEKAGTCRFEIVDVAKSKGDIFKVGETIELPQYIAGKKDGLYALMGPDEDLIDWHIPSESTESSWKYLSELPPAVTDPEAQTKRLAFFIDYLEHPEVTVANDAYAEFALAPYDVITPLKDLLPRDKLRAWIANPETAVTRLGLYGVLLGQCGKAEDAEVMKQKILYPDSDFRLGINGVMFGYLILTGEEGLKVLEDSKMRAKTFVNKDGEEVSVPFSERYATMYALRYMWDHEPDILPKKRLKQSMRVLLERPELADLVITDLARWKDWGVQERLMKMYDDEQYNIPSVKRAIVRYFYYCSQDKEEDVELEPEYIVAATENLRVLEEKDPKTVRNAKRFLNR